MQFKTYEHFHYESSTGQVDAWFHNTNFELNAQRGSRVISLFTKRARLAKMMLGEASSLFCIPVAGQC